MKRIIGTLTTIFAALALSAQQSTNSASAGALNSTNSTKEYLSTTMVNANEREFKPRDLFRFSVKEDPTPTRDGQEAAVTDGGEVHFLVSGQFTEYVTVDVRNKKLPEIRAEVKRLLDEKYYENATVSLDLAAINRNTLNGADDFAKALVYGAVNGTVPLPEGKEVWLSEAVLQLGAKQNQMANLKSIKLHRKNATPGEKPIEVNLEKILRSNARDLDYKLKDGDRIEVPERVIFF
jgi:hypothetical protein